MAGTAIRSGAGRASARGKTAETARAFAAAPRDRKRVASDRVTRALEMVNAGSRALLRATDESQLLTEICQAVVRIGGYRLAWVGFAEDDASKTVRPVASAGGHEDYVARVKASWGDNRRGRGPVGTAIRTGKVAIEGMVESDPNMAPWRAAAARHGLLSLIAIPLKLEGKVFGVLAVYAAERDAFDVRESKLLSDFAADLAYGLGALRTAVARKVAEDEVRRHQERYAKAELELRQSAQKFRNLVENSPDWIWEVDPSGAFTYSSPCSRNFVGKAPEDLLGTRFLDLMAPDEAARIGAIFGDVVARKAPFSLIEQRLVGRDGQEVIVEASGVPVLNPDGSLAGVQGMARDVTETRRLTREKALQAAIASSVQEASIYGILLVDQNARIISCNRRFLELWNVPPELMAAGDDAPVLRIVASQTTDPEAFAARVDELYRSAEATSREELTLKDGRTFDRYSAPVKLAGGEHVGRVWFFGDITDRVRAESERALQTALMSAVQDASIDGILVVDPKSRIISYNRRFLELWSLSDGAMAAGLAPSLRAMAAQMADPKAALADGAALYRSAEVVRRDELTLNDGRIFDRYSAPVRLASGEFVGRVAFFRDITEHKAANQKIVDNETRFRSLVEQDIAGIVIIGADGVLSYANPAMLRMVGFDPREAIGQPFGRFMAPDQREILMLQLARRIRGEAVRTQFETALLSKDGRRVDVIVHATRASFDGKPASVAVLLDISDRKRAEEALQRLNRTLRTLTRGNEALVRAQAEPELLQAMCRTLVEEGGYALAWIGTPEHDKAKAVTPVAWAGERGYLEGVSISWANNERGRGLAGRAIRLGEAQTSQNLANDPRMKPWQASALKHGFASSAVFPLKDGDEVFAVMSLYSREPDAFSADELKLLLELANDLAYGVTALRARVDREAAVRKLRTSLIATISAMASTTEARDPYTAGHQHRVAELAAAIARDLKLPEDQVQGIYLASSIHDIGKITVPSELLTKPGNLSSLELQLIQTHAQAGYDIVKGVEFPWPIAQAILQHHERLDGSGYPNGLKGDKIILEAKILAVADVVEAMMSQRPYRVALGIDAALAEVLRGKGSLYDAAAVDACVRLFHQKGFSLT